MHRSVISAWVRFLRLPAVLTVPGDVWVGAMVAGRSAEWKEVAAVCVAYVFGMGFNDVRDRHRDAETRPDRPLPSGDISTRSGSVVCACLASAALLLLPGVAMVLLLLTISAYTFIKTRSPFLGAVLMGLCRFQSIWIGTGADRPDNPLEWTVPLGAAGVIFLLTRLSQLETSSEKGTLRSALFAVGLVLAAGAGVWVGGKQGPTSWAVLGTIIGVALANHAAIERKGQVPPTAVGIYLGLWIPLQTLWLLGGGNAMESAVLIFAAIALPWFQRQIAIS